LAQRERGRIDRRAGDDRGERIEPTRDAIGSGVVVAAISHRPQPGSHKLGQQERVLAVDVEVPAHERRQPRDVGYRRCLDRRVPEDRADIGDVRACAQQLRRAGVAQRVRVTELRELDRYVDLTLAGRDGDHCVPGMRAHLQGCPACRADYETLVAFVADDDASYT
jgi:hypothetical protein